MELEKSINKNDKENSNLDIGSLELFENIAYVMAKHEDKNIEDSLEEWLDNFSTFPIYQILPHLIELWGLNIKTEEIPKKSKTNGETNDHSLISIKGSRTWSFYL